MIIFRFISCTPESKTVETKMHESVLKSEYVFELENAPTPECHASTVAESKDGLVAAWFAGTKEKNKDVGIWVSRLVGTNWTAPVEIVNGVQDDGTRYPCWNPVLFQPEDQPLMLFYKVGPSPREWWGMLVISDDGGNTWSEPQKLPGGILGPIKNKPVQLANDDFLCPTSTEHDGLKVQIERTTDLGQTWTTTGDINDGKKIG
ncbi:MAG: sialidase, partial [Calditrichaeota bacterium]